MDLSSKPVLFHLSSEGRKALKGLVPPKGSFPALVLGLDEVGAWILVGGKNNVGANEKVPVMLLKWDYIATAAFEFRPEIVPARARPGFVRG